LPFGWESEARGALRVATHDKDTKAIAKLTVELELFDSCWRLAPNNRDSQTWIQLEADIKAVVKGKVTVPPVVYIALCSKYTRQLFQKQKFQEAARAFRPWRRADDSPFRLDCPMFSTVAGSADCAESWAQYTLASFFSNEVFDLFKEPTEGQPGLPAAVAAALLQELADAGEDAERSLLDLPQPVVKALDEVLRCCKALLAVADPTPGLLGASYHDVVAVFEGSDKNEDPDCEQSENEVLLSKVLNRSPEWKARLTSFYDDAKEDDHIARPYQGFQKQWAEEGLEPSSELIRGSLDLLTAWRSKLRTGACDRLPVLKSGLDGLKIRPPSLESWPPNLEIGFSSFDTDTLVMKSGLPVLKSGLPVLKSGLPVLKPGLLVLKSGAPVLKSGYPVLKSALPVLKPELPVLTSGPQS
jgi:hypothetical protein